jgi:uncharacterized protein with PIN domain
MIIGTSAPIAILRDEPEAGACAGAIERKLIAESQLPISSKQHLSSMPGNAACYVSNEIVGRRQVPCSHVCRS